MEPPKKKIEKREKRYPSRSLHFLRIGKKEAVPLLLKLHAPRSFTELRFQVCFLASLPFDFQGVLSAIKAVIRSQVQPDPITGRPYIVPTTLENNPFIFSDDVLPPNKLNPNF